MTDSMWLSFHSLLLFFILLLNWNNDVDCAHHHHLHCTHHYLLNCEANLVSPTHFNGVLFSSSSFLQKILCFTPWSNDLSRLPTSFWQSPQEGVEKSVNAETRCVKKVFPTLDVSMSKIFVDSSC